MQFFAQCGPARTKKVFVTGRFDDEIFVVESVIPGEIGAPAWELVEYLSEQQIEEISVAAHKASADQAAQAAEDAAEEAAYWEWEAA